MTTPQDPEAVLPVETDILLTNKKALRDAEKPKSVSEDILDILQLSGPIFLAMLSWLGMKTTDTALLGHVSADALAAAALSDLWTMCSAVLIQGRVLGILVGGAVGAGNPKLAGIYLQVSLLVLSIIAVPVVIAWNVTQQVWTAFGSDPDISADAGYYARVLSLSIPGLVAFGQVSQFFSAQRIMHPEVNSSLIALGLNLVFGLIFVLGIPFPNFGFGFVACPIVTTSMVYVQMSVLYVVYIRIQRLHSACWGGWSSKEMTKERIQTFCGLYFPSALGTASDFWRVAVIGAVAAKLGEVQVAVFNTSYRIMWYVDGSVHANNNDLRSPTPCAHLSVSSQSRYFNVPYTHRIVLVMVNAMSSAAGINMSMRLGKLDAVGAKQAGHVGAGMSLVFLLCVVGAVAWKIRAFGMIFTQDEEFLDIFEACRWPFTITLFLMNLSIAIEKIPYSMGRTTEVFWGGCIASWCGKFHCVRVFDDHNVIFLLALMRMCFFCTVQVPAVIFLTTYWRDDLIGLYWGMAIGYFVLVLLYSAIAFTSDWEKYARIAYDRSESAGDE